MKRPETSGKGGYEQTEPFVADSLVLRQCCRVYAQRVPDDTTLLRWAGPIQPQRLHALARAAPSGR